LWARQAEPAAGPPAVALADLRRPLEVLIEACFGLAPPLVATDPPPVPGRLARGLGRLPPWRLRPAAPAFPGGERLFLPPAPPARGPDRGLLRARAAAGRHRSAARARPARARPRPPAALAAAPGGAGLHGRRAHLPAARAARGRRRACTFPCHGAAARAAHRARDAGDVPARADRARRVLARRRRRRRALA